MVNTESCGGDTHHNIHRGREGGSSFTDQPLHGPAAGSTGRNDDIRKLGALPECRVAYLGDAGRDGCLLFERPFVHLNEMRAGKTTERPPASLAPDTRVGDRQRASHFEQHPIFDRKSGAHRKALNTQLGDMAWMADHMHRQCRPHERQQRALGCRREGDERHFAPVLRGRALQPNTGQ